MDLASILSALGKPSNRRTEFELRNVGQWLRSKVPYFKNASLEMMIQLTAGCELQPVQTGQVIILEGEIGQNMFMLLTGQVSIYRHAENESNDHQHSAAVAATAQSSSTTAAATASGSTPTGRMKAMMEQRSIAETAVNPIILAKPEDQLGALITRLGPGMIFGEVALIEECTRTASIAASEPSQLAVISRQLYNATIKDMLEKEFRQKMNFVNSIPYFSTCNYRNKRHIVMGLESELYDHEGIIVNQAHPFKKVYFVFSGEIRITCEPELHLTQYPVGSVLNEEEWQHIRLSNLYRIVSNLMASLSIDDSDANMSLSMTSANASQKDEQNEEKNRIIRQRVAELANQMNTQLKGSLAGKGLQKDSTRYTIDVCLLSPPSAPDDSVYDCSFGFIENILSMPSYAFTATSTTRTVIYSIDAKQFERVVTRRNPQGIYQIMNYADVVISEWTARLHGKIGLLKVLKDRLKIEIDTWKRRAINQRQLTLATSNAVLSASATASVSPTTTLTRMNKAGSAHNLSMQDKKKIRNKSGKTRRTAPISALEWTRGPIIDERAPGTVFHYINTKNRKRQATAQKMLHQRQQQVEKENASNRNARGRQRITNRSSEAVMVVASENTRKNTYFNKYNDEENEQSDSDDDNDYGEPQRDVQQQLAKSGSTVQSEADGQPELMGLISEVRNIMSRSNRDLRPVGGPDLFYYSTNAKNASDLEMRLHSFMKDMTTASEGNLGHKASIKSSPNMLMNSPSVIGTSNIAESSIARAKQNKIRVSNMENFDITKGKAPPKRGNLVILKPIVLPSND